MMSQVPLLYNWLNYELCLQQINRAALRNKIDPNIRNNGRTKQLCILHLLKIKRSVKNSEHAPTLGCFLQPNVFPFHFMLEGKYFPSEQLFQLN